MPAIMDDPDSAAIYRISGEPPFPDPSHPALPTSIVPRLVTLRDRQTVATIVPFASKDQVPLSLLMYLSDQFKKEVEGGDTYPMIEPMPFEKFASYWFQNFAGIMLLGNIEDPASIPADKDWSRECLGSFYIKPNYPGRSSHVCNAGFLVTDASRNRGVGRLMGETYIEWAPKLGYTYSVFNLVYETNVASCKIWDGLGFKRIGRVKGCGNLKSYPGRLIDAIIYGRDLAEGESDELVSEERFDKIKFYLKYGKYPAGADRAEKSRLRSAATHYKLAPDGDTLMLKDKQVIADPGRQYEIARQVHVAHHAGINKTTATIAERYHWSRIKETVSDVIRNCAECKELGKTPFPGNAASSVTTTGVGAAAAAALIAAAAVARRSASNMTSCTSSQPPSPSASSPSTLPSLCDPNGGSGSSMGDDGPGPGPAGHITGARGVVDLQDHHHHLPPFATISSSPYANPGDISVISDPSQTLHTPTDSPLPEHASLPGIQHHRHHHNPMLQDQPHGLHPARHPVPHRHHHHHPHQPHHAGTSIPLPSPHSMSVYQPIDPQIFSQTPTSHGHAPHHHHHHHTAMHGVQMHTSSPSPPPPPPPPSHHDPFEAFSPTSHHHTHHQLSDHGDVVDPDADTFQALLNAADDDDDDDDDDGSGGGNGEGQNPARDIGQHHHHHHGSRMGAKAAIEEDDIIQETVDRDLDMLIEQHDDDYDEDDGHIHVGQQQQEQQRGESMDIEEEDTQRPQQQGEDPEPLDKMTVGNLLSSSSSLSSAAAAAVGDGGGGGGREDEDDDDDDEQNGAAPADEGAGGNEKKRSRGLYDLDFGE